MEKKLKIVFVTGTRADYGKLKPLMKAAERCFDVYIFVSGMHLLAECGNTSQEIIADNYRNIHIPTDILMSERMDTNLARTIEALSKYVIKIKPDLLVVHGDRIDPMAGCLVGVLNNIRVAHIEGGEVTGTVDEFLRHAITKLSSIHFVANEEAKLRIIQLGEKPEDTYVIGSPDIDIMLSDNLQPIDKVKQQYNVRFDHYAVVCYHPVTTSNKIKENIEQLLKALTDSPQNYIVIYPNNDTGSSIIRTALDLLKRNPQFLFFNSIPFEDFLTILKHSDFIIGNSSAGIREACVYGIPAIDVGSRQQKRYDSTILKNIQHTEEDCASILRCIEQVNNYRKVSTYFGKGESAELFLSILKGKKELCNNDIQKRFVDIDATSKAIQKYINEICF
jgi:UDP-N-acetylglucosamine 2-epimerase (hydrolysing)